MPTTDPQDLADRYVALWNEPDPEARRRAIAQLWAPDGVHYVRTLEYRGHQALDERVLGSHDKNVRLGGNRFRAVRDAQLLRDVVQFHWEMLPAHGEQVLAVGLEVLVLNDQQRIVRDYQFIVS